MQRTTVPQRNFDDDIFTDESTIQLDHHSRICFRKKLQPHALKQRAKHPVKIHVWGGISKKGATGVVMFTGNMNATRLRRIFETGLIPFINDLFPTGHRLYRDNDPKHRSDYISDFFDETGINWWPTPPESPDLNPIERIWGSLKRYLRATYKPQNLVELKCGIKQFWMTLTPQVCQRYIVHIHKVIPKIIEVYGEPSGF